MSWQPSPTAPYKMHVAVTLAPSPLAAVLPPMLRLLVDTLAAAQATAADALQQSEEYGRQVGAVQRRAAACAWSAHVIPAGSDVGSEASAC